MHAALTLSPHSRDQSPLYWWPQPQMTQVSKPKPRGCNCPDCAKAFLLGVAVSVLVVNLFCSLNGCPPSYIPALRSRAVSRSNAAPVPRDTIVLYTFAPSDGEYANNLAYFVQHGVRADDRCEYVFVIQTDPGKPQVRRHTHTNTEKPDPWVRGV